MALLTLRTLTTIRGSQTPLSAAGLRTRLWTWIRRHRPSRGTIWVVLETNLMKRAFGISLITTTNFGARIRERMEPGTEGEIGIGVVTGEPISGILSGLEVGRARVSLVSAQPPIVVREDFYGDSLSSNIFFG